MPDGVFPVISPTYFTVTCPTKCWHQQLQMDLMSLRSGIFMAAAL
jgi:hypothetical protein